MTLRYLSVFSGIEAASVAFAPLGFVPVGFSEIDPFACAVLAERFGSNLPGERLSRNAPPNFGDVTKLDPARIGPVDMLIGGSPCQSFSIAGRRLSLSDARGNLTLHYALLCHELRRRNGLKLAVWENVDGVLNTKDNAFGCFLGALVGSDVPIVSPNKRGRFPRAGMVAGPEARLAWRVFDSQYFGVPQRRARVFLVADFGGGPDPAEVLFERKGLRGNSPPRRKARQGVAGGAAAGAGTGFGGGRCSGEADVAATLAAKGTRLDFEVETFVVEPVAFKASHFTRDKDGAPQPVSPPLSADADRGDQDVLVLAFDTTQVTSPGNLSSPKIGDPCHPLAAGAHAPAIAFSCKDHGADATVEQAPTLRAMGHSESHANAGGQVAVAFSIQERAVSENSATGPDGAGFRADIAYTLEARQSVQAVAFDLRGREGGGAFEGPHDTANIRAAEGGSSRSYVAQGGATWAVRRLTPRECERLQGFPDNWTLIPWRGRPPAQCPDGPRYKVLGNSKTTTVVRWIGARILRGMS